jgi:pimeloyl-ACP methyl ester carboxylesterase
MSRVDADGVGIEYEVTGQGRPVVLLHGFPDSGRLWRHQVPALAATGFQVISSRTCAATAAQASLRRSRPISCRCWPGTCWRYSRPGRSNAPT